MKNSSLANTPPSLGLLGTVALLTLAGCSRPPTNDFQGYLEGDFVYIGAPLSGRLDTLAVTKGQRVSSAAPLFTLEHAAETAAATQAAARLSSTQAQLDDLRKGSRPTELAALVARLAQARATAELSGLEADRQSKLYNDKVTSLSDYDRARLNHERDQRVVDELQAQLTTASLGGRTDALASAEQNVAAAVAAQTQADWSVAQKSQSAPRDALVYDTLYRVGEFVAAGQPVVALLPPENIKARFFVPEPALAALKPGAHVKVNIDGHPSLEATISYVSPQPEYTPPILYNRDNRAKLVFMIEAVFAPEVARDLHPGQPVDVVPVR
ncbi:MAG: HlyD family efflux transporter periplasmic adaptor subunit [Opitutaceae bacterium]|jgi:HlyD family secretion protein